MALHWDLSKINNYKTLCWYSDNEQKRMHPRTEVIITLTMVVGIPEITEKNWMEFFHRVRMCELAYGPYFGVPSKSDPFTPKHIHDHIGLGTNASRITPTIFRKKIWEKLEKDSLRMAERYVEKFL